jgi:aminoglycoside phosphotransferase (APT) family kinase protein
VDASGLELIAQGRDAEIFAVGRDRVLRRALDGRSLHAEAEVMEHVRRHGYPTPAVHELCPDGSIVMDRIEGGNLLESAGRKPWQLPTMAKILAGLHHQLGAIDALDSMRDLGDHGDKVVHLDLHPLNVMMSAHGPIVIDWAAAHRGQPSTDAASTWVILESSEIPGAGVTKQLLSGGRKLFCKSFLKHYGQRAEVERQLPYVIARRLVDRHLTETERRYLEAWQVRLESSGRR